MGQDFGVGESNPSFKECLAITIVKSQKTRLEKVQMADHRKVDVVPWNHMPVPFHCCPGDYFVEKPEFMIWNRFETH